MAGVALPTGLDRAPLVDGMQSQAQPNQVTFQPEVGPPKTRRRGTARTKPFTVSFDYTAAEVDDFEEYFEDDLMDGSLPMAWTDPIRGGSADWKFDPQNPYSFVARQNAVDVYVMTWRISKLP
jgi:hypothetical protein